MTSTHRTTTSGIVALALALGASAAPASAMPFDLNPNGSYVPVATATTAASTPMTSGPRSEVVSGGGYGSGTAAPTVVRVVAGNSGFDWGDAGIGAAGGLALAMVGLGGGLAVSQRRARRTHRPTALIG
ncbi:MAG: hypothetical protein ACRDNK_09120 [Solirubrobacteraceae bacterium]